MTPPPPRPRRSALYLPASNPRAIAKARELPCDMVILDLEDSVAPDAKSAAREQAVAAVRDGGFGERELIVRVNAFDSEWGADDLAALAGVRPDGVLVPKVDGPDDLARIAAAMGADRRPLWAMIETPLSLFRLEPLAATAAALGTAGFILGLNDLAKDMGAMPGRDRAPFFGAMGLAVAAARAYRIAILDGVCNAIDDDARLDRELAQAVEYGFDGKTLIHPRQVDRCNAAFTPDAAAIAAARRIVAAFDDPANGARGAIRLDGEMVERLHLDQARRTLARAGDPT